MCHMARDVSRTNVSIILWEAAANMFAVRGLITCAKCVWYYCPRDSQHYLGEPLHVLDVDRLASVSGNEVDTAAARRWK